MSAIRRKAIAFIDWFLDTKSLKVPVKGTSSGNPPRRQRWKAEMR
jgi:hypothetical protein